MIESKCKCGEAVNIETGLTNSFRRDGKRPHHPGSLPGITQMRCQSCHGWLADTCPGAEIEKPLNDCRMSA